MHARALVTILTALTINTALAQNAPTVADAHRAYFLGQYSRSLAMYEQLAGAGDAEAAERAAFMRLLGNGFYGPQVRTDVARAMELLVQAARAGRPGASAMLGMLPGTD